MHLKTALEIWSMAACGQELPRDQHVSLNAVRMSPDDVNR